MFSHPHPALSSPFCGFLRRRTCASRFILGILLILSAAGFVPILGAQTAATVAGGPEKADEPKSFVDALERAGIKLTKGPAKIKLGSVAELQLPPGFRAVDVGSMKAFYEFTRNSMGGNEVGVIIGPEPDGWMLFFDYDDVGFVKDEDKDALDGKKLMSSMTENQDASNAARKQRGWDEMKVTGWAAEPRYDPKTNNLTWAIKLSSSADNYQTEWINESIRLLGRGGVMKVTLVTGNDSYAADSVDAQKFLSQRFGYVSGERYAEFKKGDKVAEYGLAALVLGGAGALAYKVGFLQKFWKLLVAGAVAAVAGLGKLWNRISGKNPRE